MVFCLLPDYLWGIETGLCYPGLGPWYGCFQTTYEELKPYSVVKDQIFLLLPDYLWGIETRQSNREWIRATPASRLPMRNWNRRKCKLAWTISLPDYLWGIETFAFFLSAKINTASRLPMRNWNRLNFAINEDDCASRLPMRNWNPVSKGVSSMARKRFQTTYEELKRSAFKRFSISSCRLPDYLWGIETLLRSRLLRSRLLASRLPMRNWNHKKCICKAQ